MLDSTNPLVNATNGAYDEPDNSKRTALKLSDGNVITVAVPKDCSEEYFRRVVAAAFTAYQVAKKIPDVRAVAKYMGKSPKLSKISSVLSSEEYRDAMLARGIRVGKSRGLLPEQAYALEILTDPSRTGTFQNKLKTAGITYTKWRSWLKDPTFSAAFNAITENAILEHQGDVNTALINKALSGDMRAIEYYNQFSGRFDPNRIQVTNLQAIISGLIEIIVRHVSDEKVLLAISDEIDRLTGKELRALPAAGIVEDAIVVTENTEYTFDLEYN